MNVVVDGILTNYQIFGDKKQSILILHGWGRSLDEWIPTAKHLANDYTVILLDLPGFGSSQTPLNSFSIYDYADFVEKFLEKIKTKPDIMIGHSLGGRIGIIEGARNKVEKLILVDSAGIEKKNFIINLKQLVLNILKPLLFLFPSSLKKNLKNSFGSEDYKSAGKLRETFIKIVNEDLTPLLSKIKIPTTIMWGEKDTVLSVEQTKIFKKEIPNSHVRIVWGANHFPHLEKKREFTEILDEVLKNYV